MVRHDNSVHDESARLSAQLRETLSQLTEGVSIFDANDRLVAASPRALELSGLTSEQAVFGAHLRDLLVLQARAGEFGPCEPEAEADLRMSKMRRSIAHTYERTRPDGRVIEVRRSPMSNGGFLTVYLDVTAKQHAQQELRAFKFVLDSITDMVSVMDQQHCYRLVNDEWCRATGLTRAQVLGRTLAQVLPRATSPQRKQSFDRCLATGHTQVLEETVELPGRGRCELETTFYPYSDAAQQLLGAVLVSHDVTERRAQERRVRDSERFIATMANSAPALMAYWTRDLRCAFANALYQTWFGLTPEQMQGMHLQDLLGAELFAKNEPHVRAVLRGENQQFERMLVKPNGEVGYTWAQYIADIWEGEVRGFFVLVADITALKNSQMELEAVNAAMRISAIAFEGQEGIVVTDAQRAVLQVNSAVTRITGFTAADLVGQPALQLAAERHTASQIAVIVASVQDTGSWNGELWFRHADGHEFPVSLTATAVPDVKGVIANYVITYIDVTERYQRDEQRRVDEAAQRAALVREVHHRIKNNLQGITGLLQLFARANPQTSEALKQAISQVKSIATIHGLQGQSGATSIQLSDLVLAIAEQVREVWQVRLETSLAPDCSVFSIAEEETVPVALILNELLLNAVKHRDPATSGVSIALRRGLSDGMAEVRITNPGSLSQHSPQRLLAGAGRQLMTSLMPSFGAQLSVVQQGEQVLTLLELSTPVLSVCN